MSDTTHFALMNHFFGAPDDEPLRFVDGHVSILTDQQAEPGAMVFSIALLGSQGKAQSFTVRLTDHGRLELSVIKILFFARDWAELGEQLLQWDGLPDYAHDLAALCRQVGGDDDYADRFRLELNP